jgi:hypothetical protein
MNSNPKAWFRSSGVAVGLKHNDLLMHHQASQNLWSTCWMSYKLDKACSGFCIILSHPTSMKSPVITPALQYLLDSLGISLDNTIGILFVMTVVTMLLFGLLSFQTHHFYQNHFAEDHITTKFLV